MAGKIIADTLEHSTAGSVTTDYVVNGSAKAWLNYAGFGTTFNDSNNASSAVDNGIGDYTFSFVSSMSDANYAICSTAESASAGVPVVSSNPAGDEQTASQFNVEQGYTTTTPSYVNNDSKNYVSIFGDLA